jgi:hypothetical protein
MSEERDVFPELGWALLEFSLARHARDVVWVLGWALLEVSLGRDECDVFPELAWALAQVSVGRHMSDERDVLLELGRAVIAVNLAHGWAPGKKPFPVHDVEHAVTAALEVDDERGALAAIDQWCDRNLSGLWEVGR